MATSATVAAQSASSRAGGIARPAGVLLRDRIELTRNGDLLLANPLNPRLLYFPENGPAVAALLRRIAAMVDGQWEMVDGAGEWSKRPACLAPVGDEAQFVQMLRAHGLMGPAPAPASGKMVSQCASERVSECASGTVSRCASERVPNAPAAVPGGGPAPETPFAAQLAALTKRMLANRDRVRTLYLCFGGPDGASVSAPIALAAVQAAVARLTERAELEIVFHGGEPLTRLADIQTVVAETKANPVAQEKKIKLPFRISTPLRVIPDGFAAWARRMDVAILAQPPSSPFDPPSAISHWPSAIASLAREGLRPAVGINVLDHAPDALPKLVERCCEANAGAGLVFSTCGPDTLRGQWSCGQWSRGHSPLTINHQPLTIRSRLSEFADVVLEVQRSRVIPLRRMHPQNDWLERIELSQGLPWSCGMAVGQVVTPDGDGNLYTCPCRVGCDEWRVTGDGSSIQNPKSEIQNGVTAFAIRFSVDAAAECQRCSVRYLCGGGCSASAERCVFQRKCIEDLLFEVARNAASEKE